MEIRQVHCNKETGVPRGWHSYPFTLWFMRHGFTVKQANLKFMVFIPYIRLYKKKTPLRPISTWKRIMSARCALTCKIGIHYSSPHISLKNTFPKYCKELKILIFNILQKLPFLISRQMVNKGQYTCKMNLSKGRRLPRVFGTLFSFISYGIKPMSAQEIIMYQRNIQRDNRLPLDKFM